MDLKRLQYFCVIVEQGQISRAAKVLNMSQPPLSQRLKELEAELDATLIIRKPGVWELTEAGKTLYNQAKSLLVQFDGIRESIKDSVEGLNGEVTIGVSTATVAYVEKVIPALHTTYPKLHFRIKVADSYALEEELHNRALDFAILLLPLEKEGMRVYALPEDRYAVVFPRDIPPPHANNEVSLDDVAGFPLVLSRRWWGWGGYKDITSIMKERGHRPRIVLDSQNIQTLVRIMQGGLAAVMIMPGKEVTASMRAMFSIRPLKEEELKLRPVIVHSKDKILSQAAMTTLQAILKA